MLLSDDEREFLDYWEKRRDVNGTTLYQFLAGIPFGLLFAAPVFLIFFSARFWYRRADAVGVSQFHPLVLVIACLAITLFTGYVKKRLQWEKNEELYWKLKTKSGNDKIHREENTGSSD